MMKNVNTQFEVIRPTLDELVRSALPLVNPQLVNPHSKSPLPLFPGEFVADAPGGKYDRATDAAKPAYAVIEDFGDYGVQASRKLSALRIGSYEANTGLFDPGLTTLGAPVMIGDVNVGDAGNPENHTGLVAHTGSNIIVGYVTKLAAENGGRLRFIRI